jgi:DNA-binding Lrp family transcriptional regulator
MDEFDSRILHQLQHEFPLCENPYEVVAERLNISGRELWSRVQRMLDDGVIRRIGASFDSKKLGFSSTLAAVSVEPSLVERAAEVIGAFPEVTHNYLRDDTFNIWFTMIAADEARIERVLEEIRESLSLERSAVLNLPVKRLFKLDARFGVSGQK